MLKVGTVISLKHDDKRWYNLTITGGYNKTNSVGIYNVRYGKRQGQWSDQNTQAALPTKQRGKKWDVSSSPHGDMDPDIKMMKVCPGLLCSLPIFIFISISNPIAD